MENVCSTCLFLLVPGLLASIVIGLLFLQKVVEMERAHPCGNFHSGFDACHLLQLSTNRFFQVNGGYRNTIVNHSVRVFSFGYFLIKFNWLWLTMVSRDGTVVRALASHQCDPGSIAPGVLWVELLLVLTLLRGFFFGYVSSPASTKTNISKFQFNQDRGLT